MKPRPLFPIIAACLMAAVFPAPVQGQINALKKAVETQEPEKPAASEKPEDARKRLKQWHQEATDALARLEAAGAGAALPAGITSADMESRRSDLEQLELSATRSIKNLDSILEARKALEQARAEEASWSGFKEDPPYSLLMIDELLNERDAIKAKLDSYESSLANYERILTGIMVETKTAEEAVNTMIAAVQNAGADQADAAKWRLESARIRARMLVARGGLLQSGRETLRDQIAAAKSEIALLDRKVRAARTNSSFSEEDLAKLTKISAERKTAIQKEAAAASKRLKTATAARIQAQSALDALAATADPGKPPEGLELAKFRVDVADSRVESLQSLVEGFESLIQMENLTVKAYQDRRAYLTATTLEERNRVLESLALLGDRIRAWENVVENEIANCGADLSKVESRAASITSEDPRFDLINEQRAAKSEKLALLQRMSQAVGSQRKLLKRWIAEYSPKPGQMSFHERVSRFSSTAWSAIRKVWSFEVMSFEDKVEVDGQTITGKLPVTLGMLLRALLFFVIGYWIAARIAGRIQRSIVSRGHIAEAQAKTLRNWAMIVVGVFLVLGTLAFLKIPLTVFAFFGGALAIGLGFGLQTLIKNFISGIIVLAERKVRVGDILDVDGIVGTVVEVNTRSSIIRSPDDVETMIPNSVFLENRVTNWTLSTAKMRRKLTVGVAYGTDPKTVMEILAEAAGRHGKICKEPAPFSVFDDFGDNALIFSLYFWVDMHGSGNAMVIASDLRLMIEKRFTEAGIGIPFPQRDMHLTTDQPIQVEISNPPA
jgi:small-conductance mechanosensitive channel